MSARDPRLVGYLQRALRAEITAITLYLSQAHEALEWGLPELHARLLQDARDELEHERRIVAHLVHEGIAVRALDLPPLRRARSPEELAALSRTFEAEVVELYDDAAEYCRRFGHREAAELFEALLDDERQHLASVVELGGAIRAQSGGGSRG